MDIDVEGWPPRNVMGIIECVDMFLYIMGQCSARVPVGPLL